MTQGTNRASGSTPPNPLTELADRVEKLTGPCRETDLAISVAINFKGVFDKDREWKWSVMADDIEGHKDGKKSFLDPAQFVQMWTESLDAAMMLVPNDIARKDGTIQTPFPRLERCSETEWHANIGFGNSMIGVNAKARTPARALTAASIRARASMEWVR